jgi:glycosyltransferase involved in cell wall biosynthesis
MTNSGRIRILHLFVTLPVGGAENLLISILGRLNKDRYESVVCTLGEQGVLGKEVVALGVPLVELGLKCRNGNRSRLVHELTDLIRHERIDLVHTHLYHANFYGRLAARRAGVPCVISIHNTYTRPKWHRRLANWWLARHTAAILAGSTEIRRDIIRFDRVPEQLIEVIPNSVDLSRSESSLSRADARTALNLNEADYILGTVGRLEEQKGHRFLIDALAYLRDKGLDIVLLLVGEGREEPALRARAERLGLGEKALRFLGTRSDLGDLFRAMDLFVMPSLWEGLSLAMLSAMAAKLPVVATDVGGVGAVLGKDERGLVVPPGDAMVLAARIEWCHAHRTECAHLGAEGAAHVRSNYSDQAMVARVESVYERVIHPNAV